MKSGDSFRVSSLSSCKLWSRNSAVRHGSKCSYLLGHPTSPTAIDFFRSSRGQDTGQTVCGGSGPVAEWPQKNVKLSEHMAGPAQGYKP